LKYYLLLLNGRIYMVSDDGVANCIDAATGDPVWSKRLGGSFAASRIYADGHIYFCDLGKPRSSTPAANTTSSLQTPSMMAAWRHLQWTAKHSSCARRRISTGSKTQRPLPASNWIPSAPCHSDVLDSTELAEVRGRGGIPRTASADIANCTTDSLLAPAFDRIGETAAYGM
jgi:hypothetical protein